MENWKKIIFLDIDGVMASIPFLTKSKGHIDPEKCELLNQLNNIGAEVVISSSWGYDEGRTEASLRECGLTLPIIGYTQHFYERYLCRGNEIEKWLIDNFKGMGTKFGVDPSGVPYYRKRYNDSEIDYEYVIFDDNSDFLLGQKENFIQIDQQTGLTQENIDTAIRILTRN